MGFSIFIPPPLPANEGARSAAVAASGLLARVEDPRLMRLAARIRRDFAADWAGITLLHDDFQHVVASSGGNIGVYRRLTAISSYVVAYPDAPFCLPDARADPRFEGNPFVADGMIVFYAGAAIVDAKGFALGALCVTARTPRAALTPAEADALTHAAALVLP